MLPKRDLISPINSYIWFKTQDSFIIGLIQIILSVYDYDFIPSETEDLLSVKGAQKNFLIVSKGSFKTRVPQMLATSCNPSSGNIKPLYKVTQLFRDRQDGVPELWPPVSWCPAELHHH